MLLAILLFLTPPSYAQEDHGLVVTDFPEGLVAIQGGASVEDPRKCLVKFHNSKQGAIVEVAIVQPQTDSTARIFVSKFEPKDKSNGRIEGTSDAGQFNLTVEIKGTKELEKIEEVNAIPVEKENSKIWPTIKCRPKPLT